MNAARHAALLNTTGVIVLLFGLGSATLLFRLNHPTNSNPNGDWQDSTLTLTDSKSNARDIELYGGKLEVLMVKCLEWLRRPESLVIIIAATSVLTALGCFLFARRCG